jgi:hypothetical protein
VQGHVHLCLLLRIGRRFVFGCGFVFLRLLHAIAINKK